MAKAAGQITRDNIGYKLGYLYGEAMPAFLNFLLFVPLQPPEFCLLDQSDVLQRFALYKRIELGAGVTLTTKFQIGNFLSFNESDAGSADAETLDGPTYQSSYIYAKRPFSELGTPPTKTLPVYVDAFMTIMLSGGYYAGKIFNIDFKGIHDIDGLVGYDDKAIRHDMSTQDLIDYNMPMSSFLIRNLLIRSYNAMIHAATCNYSYILFGGEEGVIGE